MKVLLITHFFPPLNRMGSSRPLAWANYSSQMGNETMVLTPKKYPIHGPLDLDGRSDGVAVREVDYIWPTHLSQYFADRKGQPLVKIGFHIQSGLWFLFVVLEIIIKHRNRWDVIISSQPPPRVLFLAWIAKVCNRKALWVADYRDLWTDYAYKPMGPLEREIAVRLQKVLLRKANLITAVSEPFADALRKVVPTKDAIVVYNGYERVHQPGEPASHTEASFVFTGTLYANRRTPKLLFKVLRDMFRDGSAAPSEGRRAISVVFVGDRLGDVKEMAEEFELTSVVEIVGAVSRKAAQERQRRATVLLSFGSDDAGVVPGKIFEYIAACRPILAIGDSRASIVGNILETTGVGLAIGEEELQLREAILEVITAGRPSWYAPRPSEIERYSRACQSRALFESIGRMREKKSN